MKINVLKIKDFRGFRDCEITFPKSSNIVVFIGVNGAGKSAILDAMSIILDVLVGDICYRKYSERRTATNKFNQDNINLNAEKYVLDMEFSTKRYEKSSLSKNHLVNTYTISLISLTALSLINKISLNGTYNDFTNELELTSPELLNLPILIYYQSNRNIIDNVKQLTPKNTRKYKYSQCFAYENTFNNNINPFNDFSKWFREEEDLENQEQINLKDFTYRNQRLEIVRNAINNFLNKFEFAKFSDLRVERERIPSKRNNPNEESITSSLIILKDGQKFKFSQLSSGEKMMLSLVVDIARRLAIANPSLENKLEGEGIVLVDEIDLHLHPQWQRKLLPALTYTFPNIQFIVTTHSPQVLSHLSRESVFLLEDNKISDREIYTEGRDSNSILQDAFQLPKYEKEYENKLREIYRLIDNDDGENAQELLEKLKEKRGENDLEVMRMQSYIDLL